MAYSVAVTITPEMSTTGNADGVNGWDTPHIHIDDISLDNSYPFSSLTISFTSFEQFEEHVEKLNEVLAHAKEDRRL